MNCEYCQLLKDLSLRAETSEQWADILKREDDHMKAEHSPLVTESKIHEGGTPL